MKEWSSALPDAIRNTGSVLLWSFWEFYKGQYHKFFLSTLFFLVKHAPALFSSLLIANVINGVVAGGEAGKRAIVLNTGIWLFSSLSSPSGQLAPQPV